MLIRRCNNCKHEYGFKETEETGFSNGYCQDCYFWVVHYNRWRRLYEKNPTNENLLMKELCESFLKDKRKPILLAENEDARLMRTRGGGYDV